MCVPFLAMNVQIIGVLRVGPPKRGPLGVSVLKKVHRKQIIGSHHLSLTVLDPRVLR
jgi:hypothetical protein